MTCYFMKSWQQLGWRYRRRNQPLKKRFLNFIKNLIRRFPANPPGQINFFSFQPLQNLMSPGQHLARHARQSGNLKAVAFVCYARSDFTEKYNFLADLLNGHTVVFNPRVKLRKLCQFVIMGRKQRFCLRNRILHQVFRNCQDRTIHQMLRSPGRPHPAG